MESSSKCMINDVALTTPRSSPVSSVILGFYQVWGGRGHELNSPIPLLSYILLLHVLLSRTFQRLTHSCYSTVAMFSRAKSDLKRSVCDALIYDWFNATEPPHL